MSADSATDRPSDGAIVERALSLANEAVWTIKLQHRRLRTDEPEDDVFFFRRGTDFQFLIVAMRRLRLAAELAAKVEKIAPEIRAALEGFDRELPMVRTMRNVGEHIDDYALDAARRRHKEVGRRDLQVGSWDGRTFTWLGIPLPTDTALEAAGRLLSAMRAAAKRMKQWYFAYGSNMCLGRLWKYDVEPEEPGLPIRLDGYVLRFNKRSDDGSGKANVEPSHGSAVWGVLYAITQAELNRLNEGEKGYTAVRIAMQIPNVGEERCWFHIADANRVRNGLRPYSWYIGIFVVCLHLPNSFAGKL